MTATTRKLGRRQVDVLRAAATGKLVRFDDGGWTADGHACTPAARSVAHLLADGKRGAVVTGGSWTSRPGVWMVLTDAGQAALDAWELANPEPVIAHLRRAAAIREIASKPGDIAGADIVTLAARDEHLADDAWNVISRTADGQPVIDE